MGNRVTRTDIPGGQLRIITSTGAIYDLPFAWSLDDAGSFSPRLKLVDRAFAHGSYLQGDGKISGRTIKVGCHIKGDSPQTHDELLNEAYMYFGGTDYKLITGRSDRAYHVAGLSKASAAYVKGYKQRYSEITVSLLLADPFRYATEATLISNTYATAQTGTIITFNNASGVDVPLIFTFYPAVTMAAITVVHVESQQQFILTDTLLTSPAVGVVNAETGTVHRDSNNAINAYTGLFLHALPGSNSYKITCDAGRVEIGYTERWIV